MSLLITYQRELTVSESFALEFGNEKCSFLHSKALCNVQKSRENIISDLFQP